MTQCLEYVVCNITDFYNFSIYFSNWKLFFQLKTAISPNDKKKLQCILLTESLISIFLRSLPNYYQQQTHKYKAQIMWVHFENQCVKLTISWMIWVLTRLGISNSSAFDDGCPICLPLKKITSWNLWRNNSLYSKKQDNVVKIEKQKIDYDQLSGCPLQFFFNPYLVGNVCVYKQMSDQINWPQIAIKIFVVVY